MEYAAAEHFLMQCVKYEGAKRKLQHRSNTDIYCK